MNRLCRNSVRPAMTILALACAFGATAAPDEYSPDPLTTPDASGWLRTFTPAGTIDTGNPFFQSLGTNGRSCNSCHRQAEGWTVTPAELQQRFDATQGLDPIFRTNDGSVSPSADVSTLAARRKAYALLLARGLIRVGLPIPANAEFSLTAVDDPYHYASAAELSLFRRPLPDVLRERIMAPIGASPDWEWLGYDNADVEIDGKTIRSVPGGGHWGGGLFIGARDHARLGLLVTREGNWAGKQLVPAGWIRAMLSPSPTKADYGYLWWLKPDGAVAALGAGSNHIWIDAGRELVVVLRWIENAAADPFFTRLKAARR